MRPKAKDIEGNRGRFTAKIVSKTTGAVIVEKTTEFFETAKRWAFRTAKGYQAITIEGQAGEENTVNFRYEASGSRWHIV